MDSLITAARALAAGDLLGALKRLVGAVARGPRFSGGGRNFRSTNVASDAWLKSQGGMCFCMNTLSGSFA
jgi:hypothetical protein